MLRGVSQGAFYNPASVAITGGTIDGAVIGGVTPAAITGTTVTATTAFRAADGSAATPSYSFTNATSSGLYQVGTAVLVSTGGAVRIQFNSAGFRLGSAGGVNWTDGNAQTGATDLTLARDAANTVAQRNGTANQETRLYDRFTSATDYSRFTIKFASTTLASVTGASVTATNLIPAKANVLGVNTKVTVALGTGSGTTGYTVGDGSDADRWGAVSGTATTTATGGAQATADPTGYFNAANNVVITAAGGNFDGTGSIYVSVAYFITEAD